MFLLVALIATLLLPSTSEALIARFNEILATRPMAEAMQDRSNETESAVRILFSPEARSMSAREGRLLARLVSSFPGANTRLVLLHDENEDSDQQQVLELLGKRLLRWPVLPPTEEEFDSMLNLGIPVSLVGMHHSNCSSVAIDDVAATRTATQHLVNQGHKKIGLMSGRPDDPFNFSVPQDRRKGFLQVLVENGLEWDPSREVHGGFTMHTAARAMDDLLARPNRPTAIFCESDEMAFGVMQAIRRHGLKCPDDISIIGFDGHEMSEFSELTTIEQPVQLMGEMAAWSIMERLRKPLKEPVPLIVPTTLVVRNSTKRLAPEHS